MLLLTLTLHIFVYLLILIIIPKNMFSLSHTDSVFHVLCDDIVETVYYPPLHYIIYE